MSTFIRDERPFDGAGASDFAYENRGNATTLRDGDDGVYDSVKLHGGKSTHAASLARIQEVAHTRGMSEQHKRNYMRLLLPLLWPRSKSSLKFRVVLTMLLLLTGKLLAVVHVWYYKYAVDELVEGRMPTNVIIIYGRFRYVMMMVVVMLGDVREMIYARVAQWIQHECSLMAFRQCHLLSLDYHVKRRSTGSLVRVIDRGTRAITNVLQQVLFILLPSSVEIILVLSFIGTMYSMNITVSIVSIIIVYVAYTLICTAFRREMNDKDSFAADKKVDALLNFETVKAFVNERFEEDRFDLAMHQYNEASVHVAQAMSILNVGQQFIIGLGLVIVMLFGAQQVVDGDVSIGDFVLLNAYLMQLFGPLNTLGTSYRVLKNSFVDMERYFDLLLEKPDILDAPNAITMPRTANNIEFENVCFRYASSTHDILHNISFSVPRGRSLAVVGHSGSGKTTISKLLLRFYDVDSGQILIDGHNIKDCTQDSVRRCISLVSQDTVLFRESIAYNIRYGNMDASMDDVINAAKKARLHDFVISLPNGYSTVVGERGLRLSGGERQRVSIARAILKDSSIIVFDEATSSLDSATELEIQEELLELSTGHTTITIAHRLSTIVRADEIVVLVNGEITERGTHSALLSINGVYADMWSKQQQQQECSGTETRKRSNALNRNESLSTIDEM